MPSLTVEHARLRRPKNHPISASDPKLRTQILSQSSTRKPTISTVCHCTFSTFSNNNNDSKETKKLLTKKPKKKKIFTTLRRLGCGASSASPPVLIRSAGDWEAEKVIRTKKKMKKQRKTTSAGPNPPVVVDVPYVCCVTCVPGVGIASDVVPIARIDAERTNHRVRSCSSKRTANIEPASASDLPSAFDINHAQSVASDNREFHRLRRHSPGGLPQIVTFQHDLFSGGSSDGYDQYGDWRLDVDSMSYEELLDLSDKIGYVGTGLREDEIRRGLRRTKHSMLESIPLLMSTDKDWKCSICQESWKEGDKMGRLDCGHCHHLHCIKQWLLQKNACPVCKTAAVAEK